MNRMNESNVESLSSSPLAERVRTEVRFADVVSHKPSRLFLFLGGFFIANALIAEFMGVKIFALEPTLGIASLDFNLFGQVGALQFSAGVLLWPIVFTMTDSFVVLFIAFKLGPDLVGNVEPWSWGQLLAVGTVQYAYKFLMAILLTPAIYGAHYLIDRYLGDAVATAMKKRATSWN